MRAHKGSAALALGAMGMVLTGGSPLPPTPNDFIQPGTQARTTDPPEPWMISDPIPSGEASCFLCHSGLDDPATTVKPYRWRGSMHAHSFRDPIFQAAFALANLDAPNSGEFCIRCHAPRGWLEGRATPPTGSTDGSTLFYSDRNEGITCNVCHRLVDRDSTPPGPADDQMIRDALSAYGYLPLGYGNAEMIVDPMDVRRGPLDFHPKTGPQPPHLWAYSPHHRTGDLCGTCHDVSNPILSRVGGPTPGPGDTYVPNARNQPHPTHNKFDMFAEQRTYSEWLYSAFAQTPGGLFIPDAENPAVNRFGGNRVMVGQCQDCHMPTEEGFACWEIFEPPVRDVPQHTFVGANVFALDLLMHMHGPEGTGELDGYTLALMQRQRAETVRMLEKATDTYATQYGGELTARVVNQTGHKLLTGMPEGRRIWLNVRFYAGPTLVAEHGAYNAETAHLSESDTKVYEQVLGVDETMASLTGLPVGPSFHLVFVNKVFKDNRIPPRGFSNAAYTAIQAGHVGYHYPDGQYWDDTRFCVPHGATRAVVSLYYQTSSREYIEFLRDAIAPDPRGQALFDAWAAVGRSAPVAMDVVEVPLAPFARGDVNGDGTTSFADITGVLVNWGRANPGLADGDANCDGRVDFGDITYILVNWGDSI